LPLFMNVVEGEFSELGSKGALREMISGSVE
jgi:hypothetical protein